MGRLKLVLFDVDGTLIDSQHDIVDAMAKAAMRTQMPEPTRAQTLSVVGLSLPDAIARLYPSAALADQARMVDAYRDEYAAARNESGTPPLYDGALVAMEALKARDDVLLGTATGMSRRGMTRIIDTYGLDDFFATTQTADTNPSKPHPGMVLAALAETGVAPRDAVFVGDTVYDIQAGQAAGVFTIGVTWGYHAADDLRSAGADRVIDSFADLLPTIDKLWSAT